MRLDELRRAIMGSGGGEWLKTGCWGVGTGPSYADRIVSPNPGEPASVIGSHDARAAFVDDVSISLAWGMQIEDRDEYAPDWMKERPTWNVSGGISIGDVFYCGQLVERVLYTLVDGGRCKLPLPDEDMHVTEWEYEFVRVLNAINGVSGYEPYMAQAGISVEG